MCETCRYVSLTDYSADAFVDKVCCQHDYDAGIDQSAQYLGTNKA